MALRVASFPQASLEDRANYVGLLERALQRTGAHIERKGGLRPGWALRTDVDIVHLHWLEHLIASDRAGLKSYLRSGVRAVRLVTALAVLRARGVATVWTVHNLRPHENRRPRLEAAVARSVFALANRAIVHSHHARTRATERFGRPAKLRVIPNGNYVGLYPPDGRPRVEIRRGLELPEDAFVVLVFGQLRAYKNVPRAIAAFGQLPDRNARLIVAGRPHDAHLRQDLECAAAGDPRVRLLLRYVADEEVARLHEAADAAVLAYDEVFSSGALLLALSLGLPVVAPAGGSVPEVAGTPAIEGYLPGCLSGALARVAKGDQAERRRAARAAAEHFDWDGIACATLAVYEEARGSRTRRRRVRTGR